MILKVAYATDQIHVSQQSAVELSPEKLLESPDDDNQQ